MSTIDQRPDENPAPASVPAGTRRFLWQQLPYIVALLLAVGGVAYTNVSHQPLVGYWEFLAMAIGVVCVVTKWPAIEPKDARFRLIWTQALHWLAVLITMNMMLVSTVQRMLPAPATSLVLLALLALGTFLAGVSLLSLQIAFLGLAMGVVVPVISWVKQSIIFFLLGGMLLIGLGIAFWLHQDRPPPAPARTTNRMEALMRKIGIVSAIGALALLWSTGSHARPQMFRVGRLVCSSTPRIGLVVGSTQALRCVFHATRPPRQYIYEGRVRRIGLDLGVTSGGVLSWAVIAKNSRIGPGTLRGHYVGASGNVALGLGLGANVLIGGSRRSVMLQPLSVERSIGVNLAAGVASLTLGPRGRR
jgi:hypothetical protein